VHPAPFSLFEVGMLQVSVSADASQLLAAIGKLRADKLPKAITNAANELGRIVHGAMKSDMAVAFDRPTPWTMNSLRYKLATEQRPVVDIWLAYDANKGTPAEKYLSAQITGGGRRHKRFERALIASGNMPADMYAVPSSAAPLDAYGNVPGSFIVRMLSDLRAFGEQGYRANRRGKRTGARKTNYFFRAPGYRSQHLRPGIYWHLPNGSIVPVFVFARSPQYAKRYPFYELGRRVYDRYKDRVITRHLKAALAS
jgi:hypothetical protein